MKFIGTKETHRQVKVSNDPSCNLYTRKTHRQVICTRFIEHMNLFIRETELWDRPPILTVYKRKRAKGGDQFIK